MSFPPKNKKPKRFDDFEDDSFYGSARMRSPAADEPERDEPPPPPPIWPDVLDKLLSSFAPATETDYAETLTSQEIQNMIYEHCGDNVLKPDLYNTLIEKGYTYMVKNDTTLQWLLKKAN